MMEIEHIIRYAPHVAGMMEIEHEIRSPAPAVGLKPSANQGKARRRGRDRIISSKTISPRLCEAKSACAERERQRRLDCLSPIGYDTSPAVQGNARPYGSDQTYNTSQPHAPGSTSFPLAMEMRPAAATTHVSLPAT